MERITRGSEIPVGLAVALGKCNVMDAFFSLSAKTQHDIIDYSQNVQSKNEMDDFIQTIFGVK